MEDGRATCYPHAFSFCLSVSLFFTHTNTQASIINITIMTRREGESTDTSLI